MARQVSGFVSEITDARRKILLVYHIHDSLHHKREIWHGRALVIAEETQCSSPCRDVEGDLCHRRDSDRCDQPDTSGCREVVQSPGFGTVGSRGCFGLRLFSSKKGHAWRVMKKDLPMPWHSCSDVAVSEGRFQFTFECQARKR